MREVGGGGREGCREDEWRRGEVGGDVG